MNVRKLTLIATTALAVALSGSVLAEESDQQHEGHHPGTADAATASEGADTGMAGNEDSAAVGPAVAPGMMLCQPMMAQMMGKGSMIGKGSMMSKMGMMGEGNMGKPMKGVSMMGPDGKAMAHTGFPKLIAVDAIKSELTKMIADNKRLKVGKLELGGDFSISAEITTVEGSLVHKLMIDRRDGSAYEVE